MHCVHGTVYHRSGLTEMTKANNILTAMIPVSMRLGVAEENIVT